MKNLVHISFTSSIKIDWQHEHTQPKLRGFYLRIDIWNRQWNFKHSFLLRTNNRTSQLIPFLSPFLILTYFSQNSDIVLMLESGYVNMGMNFEQRFYCQAPIVKCYADAIANECPRAFIIVCASPIDCMVPLIAEVIFLYHNYC